MSTLNDNLLQIYNTKLEIKDAIGTNSDIFSEYPDLIRNLKNGIVPTGTLSYVVPVDMYGPYTVDVASYSYVSVSLGKSSAYIYANGKYTPSDFGYSSINSNIIVNVPGPSGNKLITQNGNYDISSYISVSVNVDDVEPNLLVNAWSGYTAQEFSNDVAYVSVTRLVNNNPVLFNKHGSADSVDTLIAAQYGPATNEEWYPSDDVVNIVFDNNLMAGGTEDTLGWLKITFASNKKGNGFIRVKFSGLASNEWSNNVRFNTNWITFEWYRGA